MRLVHALPALLLAPLVSLGTASASPSSDASQTREQAVRISFETTTPWVKRRGTAHLNGRVRGVRGATTVTIMQRTVGKSWTVEAKKRTSRKGYFKHHEDIKSGTRDYKACVQGKCSKAVRVRMGTPPSQPTAVSLGSLSASSVEAGQAFNVQGTATGLNGYSVAIQAYDAGSSAWSTIGNAGVSGGSWVATVSLTTAGKAVPLRAYFPGVTGRKSSVSNSASIAVFGWYYLYDGPPDEVANSYDYDYSSFNVNGVTYAKSLGIDGYTGNTEYVEYNLGRSCIRLATVVGLQDESSTSTRSTARIAADAVTKWSASGIALGQAHPVTIDVTGALRLRVENTETTSGSGYLVFGDARALCAF